MSQKNANDWEGYEEARRRIVEVHGEELRTYSARAYEYGVLSVKNFMLISGGALVALPALAQVTDSSEPRSTIIAGFLFAFSLIMSLICTYVIHLNWVFHQKYKELIVQRDNQLIMKHYLPDHTFDEVPGEALNKLLKAKISQIWWTWIIPHILGAVGLAAFLSGCWFFYSGLGLLEE